MTLNGPFHIYVGDGVVNNLGVIQIDLATKGYDIHRVDYKTIKYDFANDFPDSEWNKYTWLNTQIWNGKW
jgi:hypothetical protein